MITATVKNWANFQHYRDRAPPWIKLHRGLLDDFEYASLPIASKALAPLLWLLAAESKDGAVRVDPEWLAFRLRWSVYDVSCGLKPLIDNGFLICASDAIATRLQDACPETEGETEGEGEGELPSLRSGLSFPAETDPKRQRNESRLSAVTDDAIEAYNAILGKPNGCLPRVNPGIGRDKRRSHVAKCVAVARDICGEIYGSPTITPEFWRAYFEQVDLDPFKSGRQPPGNGHENWKPSFEYLTRAKTMLDVFERAELEIVNE